MSKNPACGTRSTTNCDCLLRGDDKQTLASSRARLLHCTQPLAKTNLKASQAIFGICFRGDEEQRGESLHVQKMPNNTDGNFTGNETYDVQFVFRINASTCTKSPPKNLEFLKPWTPISINPGSTAYSLT